MVYKMMHISVAQQADKLYSRYMLAGIILGPLSGVISGIGVAVGDKTIAFQTIATILSFLSGIVVAIIKFNKFDEVINTNKMAAAKYTSLESNVRRQLAVYRNNRIDASSYIEWLSSTYENLFSSAPLLPVSVHDSFVKKASRENIDLPLSYSGAIEINSEYNNAMTSSKKIKINEEELYDTMPIVEEYQTFKDQESKDDVYNTVNYSPQQPDNISTSTANSTTASNVNSVVNSIATSIISPANRERRLTKAYPAGIEDYSDGQMEYQMNRMKGFNI